MRFMISALALALWDAANSSGARPWPATVHISTFGELHSA